MTTAAAIFTLACILLMVIAALCQNPVRQALKEIQSEDAK